MSNQGYLCGQIFLLLIVDQFSHQYRDLYQNKIVGKDYFSELDKLALSSHKKQLEIEAEDVLSFDDFLAQYFTYNEED